MQPIGLEGGARKMPISFYFQVMVMLVAVAVAVAVSVSNCQSFGDGESVDEKWNF